jgi:hypothetical protein
MNSHEASSNKPSRPQYFELQRLIFYLTAAVTNTQIKIIYIYLYLFGRAVIAQSVQRWATGWTSGVLGFDSWWGLGIFLFTTASRTALGPTQPPIQWVLGALSLGVKRPGREADNSPPSSAEVKE